METAAELRRRADALVQSERFTEAADAYRREAAIYRRNGDINGAKVEEMKADRYTSDVKLFAHLPDFRPPAVRASRAKHEPGYGCLIGAFLDRDERLGQPLQFKDQTHRDPAIFGRMTGKKLASAFCYVAYDRPFPTGWVEFLRDQGVAPHIAWEPNKGLASVSDNAYLRDWAQAAARADCPIFLRFASEMNGDWTRYSGNPDAYKAAWTMVYKTFHRIAPNVAMVWCVNDIPEAPIQDFYPGDGYVDWVGVNFYSVPFYDNDPARPGLADNPADRLKYVYRVFASRKPIMICEYGASHLAKADGKDRSAWAGGKINQLYAALPRLYPRVKLVDVFDNDNITYAQPGRQLNNYSVTDSLPVLREYSRAVAPDYFLSDVDSRTRPLPVVPVGPTLTVKRGILRVSSWARCYTENFSVLYLLNGREAGVSSLPGHREIELGLTPGTYSLEAVVRDNKGRIATRTQSRVTVV